MELKVASSHFAVSTKRKQNRKVVVSAVEKNLTEHEGPFIVHWDGKLLQEGKKKIRNFSF